MLAISNISLYICTLLCKIDEDQGTRVPCFFAMISPAYIRELAEEKLKEGDSYLVDVSVSAANKIRVTIDNFRGVSIDQCVSMSRWIEGKLDREQEDFDLEVTSPGLDQPFKVARQYEKNLGREVEVKLANGDRITGKLIKATEEAIALEQVSSEKIDGKKQRVTRTIDLPKQEIRETRVIIKF
jgi:ribosome maturation factor RimP